MIRCRARAKVNLSLHITGKRDDGYHALSSLVVFTDFADEILINVEGAGRVQFIGEFASSVPPLKNSVTDALAWFQERFAGAISPDITVEKHIPAEAGLGGGTADCAAVIEALCEAYHKPRPAPEALKALGADVPVSFYGRPCVMEGIGEVITPAALDRDYGMVLVYPRVGVSTREAFSQLKKFYERIEIKDFYTLKDIQSMTNSLQTPSVQLCPEIGEIIEAATAQDALLVRMTGSGSTVFALTQLGEEQALAAKLRAIFPDYWVNSTHVSRSTT